MCKGRAGTLMFKHWKRKQKEKGEKSKNGKNAK